MKNKHLLPFASILFLFIMMPTSLLAAETKLSLPTVVSNITKKAKENENWKYAFLTGKEAQIVFMNVSPTTNPKNEIGLETHPFDQMILVIEGQGKAILKDKNTAIEKGDLIFIPTGTPHNVINLDHKKALKVMSIYSRTDIPANSVYKKSSEETPQKEKAH